MHLYRIYAVSDQLTIVLSIVFLMMTVAAIYFLARSFFLERTKILEEKTLAMEGVLSKSEITSLITSYMVRIGKEGQFSLIYV